MREYRNTHNTQKSYSCRTKINSITKRNLTDEGEVKDRYPSFLDQPIDQL